jgi:hypothetical protein
MDSETYRGVVRNGTVVILEGAGRLAEGTPVLITPVKEVPANGAALIASLAAVPPVPNEWVDELERLIAGGEPDPSWGDSVPDEADRRESP